MQVEFGPGERAAAEKLVDLALAEDLQDAGDLTSHALIDASQTGEVEVVCRQGGVLAGGPIAALVFQKLSPAVEWRTLQEDGASIETGEVVAAVSGPLRSLLAGERTALNFLSHLSGIATSTQRFVDAVASTPCRILDTRKTLPGYRLLAKYAVRAGGGSNHRTGLFDGVLIKDNHRAAWAAGAGERSIAEAVQQARERAPGVPVEVEVDTLEQLTDALAGKPDIVLLDNMDVPMLCRAVAARNERAPQVELEASGGMTLETVWEVALTGVDRISIGALTHSAPALDLSFDWKGRRR